MPEATSKRRRGGHRRSSSSAAAEAQQWRRRNRLYHDTIRELVAAAVPKGRRVLELGCGAGTLLAALEPEFGVGLDSNQEMVRIARERHPHLHWVAAEAEQPPFEGSFDFLVLQDLLGHLEDILKVLQATRGLAGANSTLVVTSHNFLWAPALLLAERLGWKMPASRQNWLSANDIRNLMDLAGFEVLRVGLALLLPKQIPLVTAFANRVLMRLPGVRQLGVIQYFVARPRPAAVGPEQRVSVVIPCRNEAGNIEECIRRVPQMGAGTEIIVVDGASTDGTREIVRELIDRSDDRLDLKLIEQVAGFDYAAETRAGSDPRAGMLPLGKGDAVRKGFAAATGDILMILDADMTVAPEDLPKFYTPLRDGQAEFVNGVRLVYPIEQEAIRPLNLLGNKIFSLIFSWLLGQPLKDTLCGTKALRRSDYERIARNRAKFGDFDPFGDFDLLFGAADLALTIVDMPVRYQRRLAGHTKVSVWRHGPLLLGMTWTGVRKLKWPRWKAKLRALVGGGSSS